MAITHLRWLDLSVSSPCGLDVLLSVSTLWGMYLTSSVCENVFITYSIFGYRVLPEYPLLAVRPTGCAAGRLHLVWLDPGLLCQGPVLSGLF